MGLDRAMVTKAKARSAQHLNMDDFTKMINLSTVGDVAAYLKSQTRFSAVLEAVNEKSVHREYLEQRIRSQAQHDFNALLKFMKTDKHHFYDFFIKEMEINHILFVLHAIDAGTKYHLGKFLMNLNHLMVFDVEALAQCTTYSEVLSVLENTPYEKILVSLKKDDVDLIFIETTLHNYYNQSILELIESEPHHEEILDLFKMKLELRALSHAYRLKFYFKVDDQMILKDMKKSFYRVYEENLKQWLHSYDPQVFFEGMSESYYGKITDIVSDKHVEYSFAMVLFKILKKKMRMSNDPDVILFAYMNLVEIQIDNIIDIIEGIRYAIPKQEILDLLIV